MIDISVSNLSKEFEVGKKILDGLTFQVDQGERVGLLGKNGAGKTTTLHTVTGLLPSKGGTVTFEGKDITHKPGHAIRKAGHEHVPEAAACSRV